MSQLTNPGLILIGFPFVFVFLGAIAFLSHRIVGALPVSPFNRLRYEEITFWALFNITLISLAVIAKWLL